MTVKRFVRYSITASLDAEELVEDDTVSSEELKTWYEEDAKDILMEGYASWDIDVTIIERETK